MLSFESISIRITFYEEIKMPELFQTLLYKTFSIDWGIFFFSGECFLKHQNPYNQNFRREGEFIL